MDANKLIFKIFEKGLNVDMATEICKKLCTNEALTIGDVLKLKDLLELSNNEAIEIFLS